MLNIVQFGAAVLEKKMFLCISLYTGCFKISVTLSFLYISFNQSSTITTLISYYRKFFKVLFGI